MRRLLPDLISLPAGTLQRSPHTVPENSKNELGLLYSISLALELQRTAVSRSSGRAAASRSRAGSTSRPTAPPPPPPMTLGAVPKKLKTAEEPLPETVAPTVVSPAGPRHLAVWGHSARQWYRNRNYLNCTRSLC